MLSDKDMKKIKEVYVLARSKRNSRLIKKLALKIKEITGIVDDMPTEKFVATIIKDYNHYTSK
jgi:hypothetical protein